MSSKKKKPRWRWRSAVTGRFVSERTAKRRPRTTVRERVAPPRKARRMRPFRFIYARNDPDRYPGSIW